MNIEVMGKLFFLGLSFSFFICRMGVRVLP